MARASRIGSTLVSATLAAFMLVGCTQQGSLSSDVASCRDIDLQFKQIETLNSTLRFAEAEAEALLLSRTYGEDGSIPNRCINAPSKATVLMSHAKSLSGSERVLSYKFLRSSIESAISDELNYTDLERQDIDRQKLKVLDQFAALNRRTSNNAGLVDEIEDFRIEAGGVGSAARFGFVSSVFGDDRTSREREINDARVSYALVSALLRNRSNRSQNVDRARRELDFARENLRSSKLLSSTMAPFFDLKEAELEIGKNNFVKAESLSSNAIDELLDFLQGTPVIARAYRTLGHARLGQEKYNEAVAAYDQAFEIYALSPVTVQFESVWPLLEAAISRSKQIRSDSSLNNTIFEAVQVLRSTETTTAIARAAAKFSDEGGAESELVQDWKRAASQLAGLRSRVLPARLREDVFATASQREALEQELIDASQRYKDAAERLRTDAPTYNRILSTPATLADIQETLSEDEMLVQFVEGRQRGVMLFVSSNGFEAHVVPLSAKVLRNYAQQILATMNPSSDTFLSEQIVDLGHQLYNDLLAPFETTLSSRKKLVFSLSGNLSRLPMQLLVTRDANLAPNANRVPADVAWLAQDYLISYVPAPRNILDLRKTASASRASRSILAMGDFRSNATPEQLLKRNSLGSDVCGDLASQYAALRQFSPDGGAVAELKDAVASFGAQSGATSVTGAQFTDAWLQQASDDDSLLDYRVLHFSTHGVPGDSDCFRDPFLSLTSGDVSADGKEYDGLLTTSEIRSLNLDAQLVTLSACDTSVGGIVENASGLRDRLQTKEALGGFARAFFEAGTRAVMISHWQAPESQTAELMKTFYEEAVAKTSKKTLSEALAVAQRELAEEWTHPFYWAHFVVVGDGRQSLSP